MTEEQRKNIKIGDSLRCLEGDWHFQTGSIYRVFGLNNNNTGEPVIWCDEDYQHAVKGLNLENWEVVLVGE